ncbi:MAG: aminotransferase class V-fold PLP-dependent enzyme [Solirubrobacteraceae bacterium]
MLADAFADAFPVLREVAYLNAGTAGPLPTVAADAIAAVARTGAHEGRATGYYDHLVELTPRTRAAWGRLLGAPPGEIALTVGASDGIARALALLDWQPGDHVVTSDEEHPGVEGPLGALIRRRGIDVTTAPWDDVAAAVRPTTKLVVVSHVSWLRGAVAALDAIGAAGAPVVVDAAQSAGAIPVDLTELRRHGVVAYAAAGQKWTCGPVGTGALWVDPSWAPDGGAGVWPTYGNLADPHGGLGAPPWPDARRLDAPSLSVELLAGGLAALDALEGLGWETIHREAVERAARLAERLAAAGADVAPRGPSTLVAWRHADEAAAAAFVATALEQQIVVRSFDGEPWVRAAVGAWTSDEHLDRLVALVARG